MVISTHTQILLTASLVLATLILHGCKHPLAIEGQGDIVDVDNSGRGCTLEQFQAGDSACTQNEVSGDYFVNYKAVPRPGWRFVRWEGPCPLDSEFQHCKFRVTREAVAWWDETYPENAIPPSTAVFQPIEGETGHLLAGTPVAGVFYETATQQGMTGLDGSFQYMPGETVRFWIGDTVIGAVTGRERLTPFELAGSPVLTGLDIPPAIGDEEHPFQAVINIAVLLQSLDHDASPANGIVIRQGVADLLRGVRLDLHKHWSTFQEFGGMSGMSSGHSDASEPRRNETTLRHVLATAGRQQRFSVPHRIVRPPVALERLYRALKIDSELAGVSRLQLADQNGNVLRTERFEYDARGYLTLHDDTTAEAFESWRYDARGNLIRYQRQLAKYGDFNDRVETWQYDARGNEVRHERDYGPDGTAEDVYTTQRHYDIDGNVLQISQPAETPQHSSIREYDRRGHLTRREEDQDGDGMPDLVLTWRYDARGFLVRSKRDNDADGTPDTVSSWEYDEHGRLTRAAQTSRIFSGKTGFEWTEYDISTWQYDADGKVTQTSREWDNMVEGAGFVTGTWHYQYDSAGRLTGRRLVYSNGQVDEEETWDYDAADRMTHHAYLGASGSLESARRWQYDAEGRLILFADELWDPEDNSSPIRVDTWRYDRDGNLISRERDDLDEGLDITITWEHDSNGYPTLAKEVRYFNGLIGQTVTYRYVPTGWGYLFADAQVFPYPDVWPPEAAAFR